MGELALLGVIIGAVIGIAAGGGGDDETKTLSSLKFGDLPNKRGL